MIKNHKNKFTKISKNNKFNGLIIDNSSDDDNQNNKTMLCFANINGKSCTYGNKCSYAHDIEKQKLFSLREKAYNIIKNNSNLSKVDFIKNISLYNELLTLTRICNSCKKNICIGGYNCKYGVFDPKYQICIDDLNYNNCKNLNCTKIHLTKKGLICYNLQKKINKEEQDVFIRKHRKVNSNKLTKLLIDDGELDKILSNSDSDSNSDTEIKKTIVYLNKLSESEEESIFIE